MKDIYQVYIYQSRFVDKRLISKGGMDKPYSYYSRNKDRQPTVIVETFAAAATTALDGVYESFKQ